VRVLVAVVGLGYPLLVYAGLVFFGPRVLVASAAVLLAVHAAANRRRWRRSDLVRAVVPLALVGVVLAVAAVLDDGDVFLFVPVLVNGVMLVGFARTLVRGPSMIETFARLRHPELPASRGPYLRAVTAVWCAFFAVNIAISLFLALRSTLAAWTLYNGIIAYVLAGLVVAGERVYRYWRFRGYHGDLFDPVFRRVFPPRAAGGQR
jgi:uncharacterized membrane protein